MSVPSESLPPVEPSEPAPQPAPQLSPAAAQPPSDWRASLAQELRDNESLKTIPDVGTLAKNYVEARSLVGSSLRFPSKEASAEDRAKFTRNLIERGAEFGVTALPGDAPEAQAAFWRAMGQPEKPDGYVVPEIGEVEGIRFDKTEAESIREIAHKNGLTQKQYDGLVRDVAAQRFAGVKAVMDAHNAEVGKLKQEWGTAYDQRQQSVAKWVEQNQGPKPIAEAARRGTLDAASMRWLHGMMTAFGGETSEITANKGHGPTLLTRDEALLRVGEVENRMKEMTPSDPEYPLLVQRRVDYMQIAYPE